MAVEMGRRRCDEGGSHAVAGSNIGGPVGVRRSAEGQPCDRRDQCAVYVDVGCVTTDVGNDSDVIILAHSEERPVGCGALIAVRRLAPECASEPSRGYRDSKPEGCRTVYGH